MPSAPKYNPFATGTQIERQIGERLVSLLARIEHLEAVVQGLAKAPDVSAQVAAQQLQLNAVQDRLTQGSAFAGAGGTSFTSGQDPALAASGVGFTITGTAGNGTIAVTNAATARGALSAALKGSPGAHTITIPKLTALGTDGSISWNADGVVTAFVDPT